MALALSSHAAIVAFEVVSFFMADENKTIRVDVGRDLLAGIESPPPASKNAYIERLTRHRRLFAHIAARKYDEGDYHPEVQVLVVRITPDDFA